MRRSTRLGLVILAALLAVAGAYTVYWFVIASRIESGLAAWAQSVRTDKIDASWQKLRVGGYPAAFRVDLHSVIVRDGAITPSPEVYVPLLSGTAYPWNFADWQLAAPEGLTAELAAVGGRVPAKLMTQTADGVVSLASDDGWKLSLLLQDTSVEAGARVQVGSAHATITVPPRPPHGPSEPMTGLAVDASQVKLPVAVGPLGDTIQELDFDAMVKGATQNGKLRDAAAAWRDAGGTIEFDNIRLKWRALGATAAGTIALDQDLQPIGSFSGAIQGYDHILTTLVQNGQMRATDAGLARIALTMLAKTGPDGNPEIRTAFRVQNGQMFLGPAKLGTAPRLNWE
jgi:hypothetical protein